MANPFNLHWLEGWHFAIVLMDGDVKIEATGFGICLRTSLLPGESPKTAADRLVLAEDRRRKTLHNCWLSRKKGLFTKIPKEFSTPPSVCL